MSRIPREFINDVLTRTDIVELIDARVPLKKAGTNFHACCPFHTEKTPSFTVSPSKQFYYCFGCGASGNAIGFLIAYDRIEFVDAVEILAKQLGLEIPTEQHAAVTDKSKAFYEILSAAKRFYQTHLRQSAIAIRYLQERGLTGEIAKRYAIGYAPAQWDSLLKELKNTETLAKAGLLIAKENQKDYYDRFRNRIMFPIHDRRGRVIGFGGRVLDQSLPKYLNSPETSVFHKSQVLYGLYEARQANAHLEQVLVVEGYMDVVALAQADITFAVATLGTATTEQHIQQLLQHTQQIIFCFDGDRAGQTAAWRALEVCLAQLQDDSQIKFLFLPEGEDPDSLVRKEGKEAFLIRVNSANTLAEFLFNHLKVGVNLSQIEGRAQLANDAIPYIEKITAPLLREILLDRLAELVRVEKARLNIFLEQAQAKEPNQGSAKLQRTPMRLAIALLLQHPHLAQQTVIDLLRFTLPGSELLQEIFILLRDNSQLNTAALLEYWRDRKELAQLLKLAAWAHAVPEKGLKAEWEGVLQHLQRQQHEFDIEQLVQKANLQQLSDNEKKRLQTLLAEKPT